MITLDDLRAALAFRFRPPKPIRKAKVLSDGKVYLRYSGAHLRRIRAVNGVGRPPDFGLSWQRI